MLCFLNSEPAAPFLEYDHSDPGTTHIDLVWTAPSGYLVGGYRLKSEPEEENSNLPAELSSDLDSFRVTGLMPGREYTFKLEAYAEIVGGLKKYSDPAEVTARTCELKKLVLGFLFCFCFVLFCFL